MDLSDVFSRFSVIENNLCKEGFFQNGNIFTLSKQLQSTMEARFTIDIEKKIFNVFVFDKETGEPYSLFEIPKAQGAFIGSIRNEVDSIKNQIIARCFLDSSLREEVFSYIKRTWNVEPEYPWEDLSSYAVFRCENKKWFALVMSLPLKRLTKNGEQIVDVMNVKLEPGEINKIVDNKNIFPSYHMNKKYWVSVLLNRALPLEKLYYLIDQSHKIVS